MMRRMDNDKGAADMTKRIGLAALLGLAIAMSAQEQARAQEPAKASDLTSRGVISYGGAAGL